MGEGVSATVNVNSMCTPAGRSTPVDKERNEREKNTLLDIKGTK